MTQITLNIPDNELDFFLKIVEKFNYSFSENDFELTKEHLEILDKSATSAPEDCISIDQLQIHLKNKYAL